MTGFGEFVEKAKYTREAATVSLGIFLVDHFAGGVINDRVTDSLGKKAEEALPSALIAPKISDDFGPESHSADLVLDIGMATGATLIAKQTSSVAEMAGTAIGAQIASSAVDAAIARTNILSPLERHQQDVGASAIETAFVGKFIFDKLATASSKRERLMWQALLVGFGLAATFGASYIDRKNATLDFTSHTSGLGVGALTAYLKNRRTPSALASPAEA